MTRVPIEEAGRQIQQLIDKVAKGEEIVITSDNHPVARLVPMPHEKAQPSFGSARGLIQIGPDFDEPLDDFKEHRE